MESKTCEGGTALWDYARPANHPGPCQPSYENENESEKKPTINFDNVKVWPVNTWFQRRLKEVRSR